MKNKRSMSKVTRKPKKPEHKVKMTPASILGIIIGLALVVAGFDCVYIYDQVGGYYMVAFGICIIGLVVYLVGWAYRDEK